MNEWESIRNEGLNELKLKRQRTSTCKCQMKNNLKNISCHISLARTSLFLTSFVLRTPYRGHNLLQATRQLLDHINMLFRF